MTSMTISQIERWLQSPDPFLQVPDPVSLAVPARVLSPAWLTVSCLITFLPRSKDLVCQSWCSGSLYFQLNYSIKQVLWHTRNDNFGLYNTIESRRSSCFAETTVWGSKCKNCSVDVNTFYSCSQICLKFLWYLKKTKQYEPVQCFWC